MTVALFDWDAFVYRSAFAAQKVIRHVTVTGAGDESHPHSFDTAKEMNEWLKENDLTRSDVEIHEETKLKPVGHAIRIMQSLFKRSHGYLHADKAELYLTGKDNFRHLLYDRYKANRTRPKPIHYEDVLDYSIKTMKAIVVDGMEADDMLSIRGMELEEEGKDWVIVSPDKDLLTVPGHHYNPFTEVYQVVDPLEASFNFYCQILVGDNSDNIPGIYGLGNKKAGLLLEDCLEPEEMYEVVKSVYKENGMDEDVLIRNARLLHMLRHPLDLWEPPNEQSV